MTNCISCLAQAQIHAISQVTAPQEHTNALKSGMSAKGRLHPALSPTLAAKVQETPERAAVNATDHQTGPLAREQGANGQAYTFAKTLHHESAEQGQIQGANQGQPHGNLAVADVPQPQRALAPDFKHVAPVPAASKRQAGGQSWRGSLFGGKTQHSKQLQIRKLKTSDQDVMIHKISNIWKTQ